MTQPSYTKSITRIKERTWHPRAKFTYMGREEEEEEEKEEEEEEE